MNDAWWLPMDSNSRAFNKDRLFCEYLESIDINKTNTRTRPTRRGLSSHTLNSFGGNVDVRWCPAGWEATAQLCATEDLFSSLLPRRRVVVVFFGDGVCAVLSPRVFVACIVIFPPLLCQSEMRVLTLQAFTMSLGPSSVERWLAYFLKL